MQAKTKEVEGDSFFQRHDFLIPFVFFLFVIIAIIFFAKNPLEAKVLTCGDGTSYNSCSSVQPYYCQNGSLVEEALICGCIGQINGNFCSNSFQIGENFTTLNYILDGKKESLNFTVYQGMENYTSVIPRSLFYQNGVAPSRENFSLKEINDEQQRQFLLPLVIAIENITKDKVNQARIAISIVQNIPYGFSNKTTSIFGVSVNYSRYPYDVVYDNQGICGEKSELLAFLLKEIGYETVLFYFPQENHEVVGVKCPLQYSYQKTGYCFIETTGPAIISDSSLEYVGGIKLESTPEIIPISSGISLGQNLQEYQDAKTLELIREGKLLLFPGSKFESLKNKYGLTEYYYIA